MMFKLFIIIIFIINYNEIKTLIIQFNLLI